MQSAMEQTRYWMWTRRKLGGMPLLNSLIPSVAAGSAPRASWEDQALAEDSAAHFGGYEWPPRSYSCSFCRREFRSAQALGGHMNVHRRDRARLKESSSPSSESLQSQDQNVNPCTLLGTQYQPQFSTMVYNSSPNPNLGVVAASTLSPRVSVAAFTNQAESVKEQLLSLFSPSSIIQECQKESMISDRPVTVLELKLGGESRRVREVDCQGSRDPSEDDEDTTTTRKRKRTDSVLPLFMKSAAGNEQLVPSEVVLKLKPNFVEELDLELRLGESPPKVHEVEDH